jgi:hypothetical protein
VNRKPYRAWLLLAAVLLGQWLAVAHATQHPALAVAHADCEYCCSALGSPLPVAAGAVPLAAPAAETPPAMQSPAAASRPAATPRNRGPPESLV